MEPFQNRRWVIILIVLSISLIFSIRLLYIQVINKEWAKRAEQISYLKENLQPPRGFIYDRNKELLVGAENIYDIYVLPIKIKEEDSLKICEIFKLTIEELRNKIHLASTGYNAPYKPSVMFESLSKEEFAKISPLLSKVEALEGKVKTDRGYPLATGAHLLGYIRRISQQQLDGFRANGDLFYSKNDFIGITGLENIYEKELRGERGDANYLRDYAGNKVETLDKNPATPGKDIYTTIDGGLQQLGEVLMQNKIE